MVFGLGGGSSNAGPVQATAQLEAAEAEVRLTEILFLKMIGTRYSSFFLPFFSLHIFSLKWSQTHSTNLLLLVIINASLQGIWNPI